MELDLLQEESALLGGYEAVVRREVRRAERESLKWWFDGDWRNLVDLFQDTIAVRDLQPMGDFTFQGRENLLFGHIAHPEFGVIAAQAYALDTESVRVQFLYNASAFRRFEKGSFARALCGRANRLLLHRALLHFKAEGFSVFDMGGYQLDPSKTTVDRFKQKLGGTRVVLYDYYPVWYFIFRELRFFWTRRARRIYLS